MKPLRLAVLGVVLMGAWAAAQSQLLPTDFQRTRVPGSELCLFWDIRDFPYQVDAAGSARTPGDTEFAAIEAAFLSWQTVSNVCSDFVFTRGANAEAPLVRYVADGGTNENVLTFREKACSEAVPEGDACLAEDTCSNKYQCWDHSDGTIALTVTTFSFKRAHILDADIEFNAAPQQGGAANLFTTVSSPPCETPDVTCAAIDIQNTLTHEVGHALGLDHVAVTGSTMEATAPPGEISKRAIDRGSAGGFCEAYPAGLPSRQCSSSGQLNQRIQAQSAGTSVGCNAGAAGFLPGLALLGLAAWKRRRR